MTEDLASRAGGQGADAHTNTAPATKRTKGKKTSSAPGQGEGDRRPGRPRIGKPHTVRLPEDEELMAVTLGEGSLPEGVRIALRQMIILGRPLMLDSYRSAALSKAAPGEPLAPFIEAAVRGNFAQLFGPNGLLAQELGSELVKLCKQLGDGDPVQGIQRALRVANIMGVTAVKRMDHGSED